MSKYKIKILSGWSDIGGSTVSLINLCNCFNEYKLDCTFYGPHKWHLSYCKGKPISEVKINEEKEILIIHYVNLPYRPKKAHKVILSCHERKAMYNLSEKKNKFWDQIVYVSKSQMLEQGIQGVVIPNIITTLKANKKNVIKRAGVIGSIDENKNTHTSIKRALLDGHDQVHLYGKIDNEEYFLKEVKPYIIKNKAIYYDPYQDIQKIYDSLTDVYHSSLNETYNLIKIECKLTRTNYHGLPSSETGAEYKSKEEIFHMWRKVLEI